jgi:hypothetical protein
MSLASISHAVRSQDKDSRKAMVEQSGFDEELSEQEAALLECSMYIGICCQHSLRYALSSTMISSSLIIRTFFGCMA